MSFGKRLMGVVVIAVMFGGTLAGLDALVGGDGEFHIVNVATTFGFGLLIGSGWEAA